MISSASSFRNTLPNVKGREARVAIGFLDLKAIDTGARWAMPHPLDDLVDLLLWTLHQGFHGAVYPISNPTRQTKRTSLVSCKGAKIDALNDPENADACEFHRNFERMPRRAASINKLEWAER